MTKIFTSKVLLILNILLFLYSWLYNQHKKDKKELKDDEEKPQKEEEKDVQESQSEEKLDEKKIQNGVYTPCSLIKEPIDLTDNDYVEFNGKGEEDNYENRSVSNMVSKEKAEVSFINDAKTIRRAYSAETYTEEDEGLSKHSFISESDSLESETTCEEPEVNSVDIAHADEDREVMETEEMDIAHADEDREVMETENDESKSNKTPKLHETTEIEENDLDCVLPDYTPESNVKNERVEGHLEEQDMEKSSVLISAKQEMEDIMQKVAEIYKNRKNKAKMEAENI